MATLSNSTAIPADHFKGGQNINFGHDAQNTPGHLAEILENSRQDVSAINDEVAALGAENTDGELGVDILGSGLVAAGTWTPTMQASGPRLRHTASAAEEDMWLHAPIPHRSTASKGRKVTGLEANYEVDTANLDDVRFELYKVTMAADGASRTRTLLGGDADAHYDANHDTAAKRGDATGAPELHRIVMTLPSPAYLALDEQIWIRLVVDGDAGPSGVYDLTALKILFSETLVDLA